MRPVTVSGNAMVAGCNPSQNPHSRACQALRTAVLTHYPAWQLGLIYGPTALSNQPYSDTGARARLVKNYAQFLEKYEQDYLAATVGSHASLTGK